MARFFPFLVFFPELRSESNHAGVEGDGWYGAGRSTPEARRRTDALHHPCIAQPCDLLLLTSLTTAAHADWPTADLRDRMGGRGINCVHESARGRLCYSMDTCPEQERAGS